MKISMIFVGTSLIILPVFPSFAANESLEGDVGVSVQLTDVDGNEAKFNEYRDSRDGVYGRFRLDYDTNDLFMRAKASDIGYDTQTFGVEGGMYGTYKAYFEYTEIPHNLTFGAKTFYSGAGTNNLTFKSPISRVLDWKSFDYSTDRQKYEVGASVDRLRPFFFDVSVPHEEKTGTYPLGVAIGSSVSPGSSMAEIPQPIDYTTNTLNMNAGYAKDPYFAAVSIYYSQFTNGNSALFFNRPAGTPLGSSSISDGYSLPPDNEAYKVAFKGSSKLPLHSKFSMNLATGRAKSDENVLLSSTGIFGQTFRGRVDTNNVDLVLTSNPVRFLNAKIDYKYYEKQNDSDELTINGTTNELFGYKKNKFGVDLGWSLPAKFKLDTAYSYLATTRETLADLPETKDNTLSAELKWKGLDFLTPKIRYEWLQRDADHDQSDPTDVESYIWRYDVAPQNRNTLKASVDIDPFSDMNINIGYKFKDIDYRNTVLGLRSTRSNQVNLDAGYTLGKIAQLNGYLDIELNKDYQFQRTFTTTGSPNPSTQDAADYNWDVKFKDNSYSWGLGTEIYLMPKLFTFLLQYNCVDSNGNADFSYLFAPALTGGRNNDNLDMQNWDDYRLSSYSAKFVYTPTKQYTFTLGYAYEHYRYNDARIDNYLLVQGSNYLSGAYADPNYTAHVVFMAVDYRF